MTEQYFDFEVKLAVVKDGAAVLELVGECDIATAPLLEVRLQDLVASGQCDCVVLDFSKLSFMDARGLAVLMAAHKRLAEGVVIRAPSSSIRKLLEVTSLTTVFRVEPAPSTETNTAAFQG